MKHYISNISISMLQVMDAVCRHKNTHLAADELGMTQPAISKSLKRLAEVTGKELFVRESRSLAVTDEGKAFWEKAVNLLSMCEDLLEDSETLFDPTETARDFTVVIPNVDTSFYINELIIKLPKKFPLININVITAPAPEAYRLIETGAAELYIGYLSTNMSKSMTSEYVSRLSFEIIANKQFKTDINKTEFNDAEHLFIHRQYHESMLDDQLIEAGLVQKNIKRIPDGELTQDVLLNTNTIYLATEHKAALLLKDKSTLKKLNTAFDLPQVDLHQIWLNKHTSGAAHKWLREHISAIHK